MAQHLLRRELFGKCDAGIAAVHPDHMALGAKLVAAEDDGRAFDRKLVSLDQRTFRRQVAQLHRLGRAAMFERSRKQDLRTAGLSILARSAVVHGE